MLYALCRLAGTAMKSGIMHAVGGPVDITAQCDIARHHDSAMQEHECRSFRSQDLDER